MGQVCDKVQNQQQDIEDMKKAIDQLKELMNATQGVQEGIKNSLSDVTKTTAEVTDKFKAIVSKVDGFQQIVTNLEQNIQKTVEEAVKKGAGNAVKSFF